jgi:hypothetical protein
MRIPPFSVTGIVFAVGNTHRTCAPAGVGICPAAPAHPRPVSPNPCNRIIAAFASPPRGSTTIGAGYDAIARASSTELELARARVVPSRPSPPTSRRAPYRTARVDAARAAPIAVAVAVVVVVVVVAHAAAITAITARAVAPRARRACVERRARASPVVVVAPGRALCGPTTRERRAVAHANWVGARLNTNVT